MDAKKFLQLVEEKKKRMLEKKEAPLKWEQKLEAASKTKADSETKKSLRSLEHKKRKASQQSNDDSDNSSTSNDKRHSKKKTSHKKHRKHGHHLSDSSGDCNKKRRHRKSKNSSSKKRYTDFYSEYSSDEYEIDLEKERRGKRNVEATHKRSSRVHYSVADDEKQTEKRKILNNLYHSNSDVDGSDYVEKKTHHHKHQICHSRSIIIDELSSDSNDELESDGKRTRKRHHHHKDSP
ncbi:hypothetical protein ZOSMA_252G00030 [Zostera marina]|uniref:Uncharacterized protein n=1 Tax=Zostera marina TaxID=29655 RepID=A0A0K9PI24_ZOSMR|nr:hypothetical protein ZOSMA_252G00030 [Zostera marina]